MATIEQAILAGVNTGPALRRASGTAAPSRRLEPVLDFGSNPGRLRMWLHRPADAPSGPMPLVVVLHGCLQTAAAYDRGAGWSALSDELGFAVVYAEQQRFNNPNLCFNWFSRGHSQRDRGEAESIRQMVLRAGELVAVDPTRVFVTGLSAGGAMTAVMLAVHPELFAGGAILAGLPYRAATTVRGAIDAMQQGTRRSAEDLAREVRAASEHAGPWPRLAVWHGTADDVVSPANADDIVDQWRTLAGLGAESETSQRGDRRRRIWRDERGDARLELNLVDGLGHGTPVDDALRRGGAPIPFFLDAGLSSTHEIARFFGLDRPAARSSRGKERIDFGALARLPRRASGPIGRVLDRVAALVRGG